MDFYWDKHLKSVIRVNSQCSLQTSQKKMQIELL